jgi:predicted nucleic acid-binding protein
MPDRRDIVIDTGSLIALIAALGSLNILRLLYSRVLIPPEVAREILADNATRFGAREFEQANWFERPNRPVSLPPFLANILDEGEAAVIHTALTSGIDLVCIDEPAGRRVARLHGLRLTGSMGILLRAKQEGHLAALRPALQRMMNHGIYLRPQLVDSILRMADE